MAEGKVNHWTIDLVGPCVPIDADMRYDGKTIALLTIDEMNELQINKPDDVVISIFGEETKAKDCDLDTRFGYVAFGYLVEGELV